MLRREYIRGLTVPAAVTLPTSAALVVVALPVTALVFTSRNEAEVVATERVLAVLAFGTVPFGVDVLNQRSFYAHDNGKTAFVEQAVLTATALAFTAGARSSRPPWPSPPSPGVATSNLAAAATGRFLQSRARVPVPRGVLVPSGSSAVASSTTEGRPPSDAAPP